MKKPLTFLASCLLWENIYLRFFGSVWHFEFPTNNLAHIFLTFHFLLKCQTTYDHLRFVSILLQQKTNFSNWCWSDPQWPYPQQCLDNTLEPLMHTYRPNDKVMSSWASSSWSGPWPRGNTRRPSVQTWNKEQQMCQIRGNLRLRGTCCREGERDGHQGENLQYNGIFVFVNIATCVRIRARMDSKSDWFAGSCCYFEVKTCEPTKRMTKPAKSWNFTLIILLRADSNNNFERHYPNLAFRTPRCGS